MEKFLNEQEAISKLYNIPICNLKKAAEFGIENNGVFLYKDKAFKASFSSREFKTAIRLIDQDFKNVVKIFSALECKILSKDTSKYWKIFIIEEERLFRSKHKYCFDDLDLMSLNKDVENRLPYFVNIINGIIELASVGIIHNDIHSYNIMLDKNDVPKIIDFGQITLRKKYNKINMNVLLQKQERQY